MNGYLERRWAVVNMDQSPRQFSYQHPSELSAREEAQRLTLQHRGCTFAVIEIIATCKRLEPVEWTQLRPESKELPF